ncbi:MAG: glycine zipper family protein [Gammaproteobacteria bacterium]|nr:glycine zipper family protein [Gammaproteobacteria bacterium]
MDTFERSKTYASRLKAPLIGLVASVLMIVAGAANARGYHHGWHGGHHYGPSISIFSGHHYPHFGYGYGYGYGYDYWPYRGRSVIVAAQAEPEPQRLFVYPQRGQGVEQQAQDEFECHRWAVQQTSYDPTGRGTGASTVVSVPPPPDGLPDDPVTGIVGGAALGAAGGALAGDPGVGAAVGAAVGLLAGLLGQANNNQAPTATTVYPVADDGAGQEYRRAWSTCLAGRGYQLG